VHYGRYLIDGGASCPVPVSIARKYGAEIIIAIDVTGKLPQSSPQHLFGIGKRSIDIAYRKFVELSLADADIIIQMDFEDCGTFSDHLNEHLYEHGRKAIQERLPEIQKMLAEKCQ
jgi:NTE family protein